MLSKNLLPVSVELVLGLMLVVLDAISVRISNIAGDDNISLSVALAGSLRVVIVFTPGVHLEGDVRVGGDQGIVGALEIVVVDLHGRGRCE